MYKNLELLNKNKHEALCIDELTNYKFAKELTYTPIGLSEIIKISSSLPIFIAGGDKNEFITIMSMMDDTNYFYDKTYANSTYIPNSLRIYPFLMVNLNDEKNTKAFSIEIDADCLGTDKTHKLFNNGEIENQHVKNKMNLTMYFDADLEKSADLIKELKEHDLLIKKEFKIKISENQSKQILSNSYIVDHKKLMSLDDSILIKWLRNGWMTIIDYHLNSIINIEKLIDKALEAKKNK